MQLTGGFSSNVVERYGDAVKKTGTTTIDELIWYSAYPKKSHLPNVIALEFVESVGAVDLNEVIAIVEDYKSFQPINKLKFDSYYDRIMYHVEKSDVPNAYRLLEHLRTVKPLEPTFAHGDLSIRNIIQSKEGVKLIDPLYYRNFGSYILDYAKLAFTLKFYDNNVEGFEKIKNQSAHPQFDILVACECARVATYRRNFDFILENIINELP
jgi:hypothetical protein